MTNAADALFALEHRHQFRGAIAARDPAWQANEVPTSRDALAGIWYQLCNGTWQATDWFELASRRYLVVRRHDVATFEIDPLTRTERHVCAMAATGEGNKQIGFELAMAASTVATHLQRALCKLRLKRRTDLIYLSPLSTCTESNARGVCAPASGQVKNAFEFEVHIGSDQYTVVSMRVDDRFLGELSFAERHVARLATRGCSNKDIASRRGSSVRTVANQLAAIYRRVGVFSRHELAFALCGPQR